jgi:acetyltransferase-like isoleucine patch superfamily enzyme
VYGTGNRIQIEETNPSWNTQLDVCIGLPESPANNCTLKIGRNFFSNGTMIRICENGTTVTIGDDCMFSADVQMWASDTHAVADMSGECINLGRFIRVGDRVWLGYGTTVLKNTAIADDCICGCRSLVSGLFPSSNCVIAGNPGKVCKTGVKWSRQRPQEYVNSQGTERHG